MYNRANRQKIKLNKVVSQNYRTGTNMTLDQMKNLHASGKIQYELENPPIKDTVIVPDGGYTIVRFVSDNPGFWAFHCHLSFHVETGILQTFNFIT